MAQDGFPGGSKGRVNKAGNAVRDEAATETDYDVIETWRAAHRQVLNTFQGILRNRTRGSHIIVAQRHKRRTTIFGKLERFPGMQLARMDDVAGCRLIFRTAEELYQFRKELHDARFRHKLKNQPDKYDYIKSPKDTGYRGVHDVYSYDVNSVSGKPLKGLLIELQYRTIYQHAWATAVEVVGAITESQPKFQQGDDRYQVVLAYASEIIARTFEDSNSCFPDLSNTDLVQVFLEKDAEIGLMHMLRGLNSAHEEVDEKKNVILIFDPEIEGDDRLRNITSFRDATDALRELFRLEAEHPELDIVLVRADTSGEVRIAFQNYFSDAREFINLVDHGCDRLRQT
ncbi:RelA/SpoT domain-containing protein [Qipengyuania sp. SS22]|uniref:RelA/SpoT domain-containing protein n=1 Tax=Qipengyuania sp. SS22 TaxID=2979461 RepID=UPI0021E542C3|nr:RelA/SpoT domain-containing protein [Qipengyuania sp. SS22]UYH54859.1 RelA/SpoT domain-containing protein [Qipengyuania sp. SS22]